MKEWVSKLLSGHAGSISNTAKLCNHTGNPEKHFKSIHIAGTNGKGSVTKKCAAVLQESGYSVGMYLSPHIKDYTERIQFNLQPIPTPVFFSYAEKIKATSETFQINLGWFDLFTVSSFMYFRDIKADWACIEVGMGGRLDPTNVITPEISIIVSIGMDHVKELGGSIKSIAYEKAGIIKTGVPCVYGPSVPADIIKETCSKLSSVSIKAETTHGYLSFDDENTAIAKTAIKTLQKNGLKIPDHALKKLEEKQPFRFQEINVKNVKFILDGAHNPDAAARLLQDIEHKYTKNVEITALVCMSKGKLIEETLSIIKKRADKLYILESSAIKLETTQELEKIIGVSVESGKTEEIIKKITKNPPKGVVLITGSFYIMQEAQDAINKLVHE